MYEIWRKLVVTSFSIDPNSIKFIFCLNTHYKQISMPSVPNGKFSAFKETHAQIFQVNVVDSTKSPLMHNIRQDMTG